MSKFIKRCWKCGGKGWFYRDFIDQLFNDKTECPRCRGYGKIRFCD
jgi:DnaJ-class molecular chaperone